MATPAEPILASALWTAFQVRETEGLAQSTPTGDRVGTGFAPIDHVVGSGLQYASVNCISGEAGGAMSSLMQAFIASHLMSSPLATAAIIDTTLSFDVRAFHATLKARLHEQDQPAESATSLLDRLKIMKPFDFTGLTESLAEIRSDLGATTTQSTTSLPPPKQSPEIIIHDSEDTDDSDEMLDIPHPAPRPPPTTSRPNSSTLLVISPLSPLISPLLKTNYTRGQSLLTTFLRSLAHLTRTRRLCTLLLNDATSNAKAAEESPSQFSSCALRPALGRAWGFALDVHLLVHEVVGGRGAGGRETRCGVGDEVGERTAVLEVLQDRLGRCLGRWAGFVVDGEGLLRKPR